MQDKEFTTLSRAQAYHAKAVEAGFTESAVVTDTWGPPVYRVLIAPKAPKKENQALRFLHIYKCMPESQGDAMVAEVVTQVRNHIIAYHLETELELKVFIGGMLAVHTDNPYQLRVMPYLQQMYLHLEDRGKM